MVFGPCPDRFRTVFERFRVALNRFRTVLDRFRTVLFVFSTSSSSTRRFRRRRCRRRRRRRRRRHASSLVFNIFSKFIQTKNPIESDFRSFDSFSHLSLHWHVFYLVLLLI